MWQGDRDAHRELAAGLQEWLRSLTLLIQRPFSRHLGASGRRHIGASSPDRHGFATPAPRRLGGFQLNGSAFLRGKLPEWSELKEFYCQLGRLSHMSRPPAAAGFQVSTLSTPSVLNLGQ